MSAAQLMEAMGKSALATTIALTLHPKLTDVPEPPTGREALTLRVGRRVAFEAAAGFAAGALAGRSRS